MSSDEKKELYRRLGNLDRGMARIEQLLESDNKTKQAGVVEKVNILEHRVETLEVDKKLFIQKATMYSTVAASLVALVGFIVNLIWNK